MKDLKISKELLSEVLGISTVLMNPIIESENKVGYLVYGSQNTPEEVHRNHKQINIYEFAFKCKEWAFKRELNLWTDYLGNCQIQDKEFQLLHDCYSNTEVEAIIKACEWILKESN